MEHLNVIWNNFCTQICREHSSSFLLREEQTKGELATLAQRMKHLRADLKEYHVNAATVTSGTCQLDQHIRQKIAGFCNYCCRDGSILNMDCKKRRVEEVRKVRSCMSSKKKITPIHKASATNFNHRTINRTVKT